MLKNYLLLAFRTLKVNLGYSTINILGFSISLACCFVVTLYVKTELSFEDFHRNKEQIYRYVPAGAEQGVISMQTWTPAGLAPFLESSFPTEIKAAVRVTEYDDRPVLVDNDRELVLDNNMLLADPAFFDMFSFNVIRGDQATLLGRPMTIVISRSTAEKYFPGQDPVGKVVRYDGKHDLEITGIFEDVPLNTHLQFACVVSFQSLPVLQDRNPDMLEEFGSWNYSTYIMTAEGVNINKLQDEVNDKVYVRISKSTTRPENDVDDWLQPLSEIHFMQGIKGDGITSDKNYVQIAAFLGILVLVVASFNFMNLATAMAVTRAKEVGLRKTMGAVRQQLVRQFMAEAFLQVVMAMGIAVLFVQAIAPAVLQLFGIKTMGLSVTQYISFVAVFVVGTTMLAGSYPAFYLSSFSPARVLKGNITGGGRSLLRRSLIVFQYAVSIFLAACTWVVYSQLNYMRNKDLGFDKDHILTTYASIEVKESYQSLRNALLTHPEVKDVTISNNRLGNHQAYWRYSFPNGEAEGSFGVVTLVVDPNYLDFMNIKLKEGRNFSEEFTTDRTSAFIVNETFVDEFGLSNPFETTLQVMGDSARRGPIVGIVNDFYFQPLHRKVAPIVIRMDDRNAWLISVKLAPQNLSAGVAAVETEWKKVAGGSQFTYKFMDDHISANYLNEERASSFLLTLTAFAIIIAGLGLLGLTAFMTMQRRKEIGVRKVLGSSRAQIVALFSKDILRLQIIGFALAAPLAWLVASSWLERFANRIELHPSMIVASAFLVTIFSLIIIGYQSSKAAQQNPAETLRTS